MEEYLEVLSKSQLKKLDVGENGTLFTSRFDLFVLKASVCDFEDNTFLEVNERVPPINIVPKDTSDCSKIIRVRYYAF